jgi:hypothetical protein
MSPRSGAILAPPVSPRPIAAVLRLLAPVLLPLALLLGACEPKGPATSTELASDLRAYLKQLEAWEGIEKDVFGTLAEVERTYYVDDDFVIRRFRAALPKVRTHIGELEQYRPGTEDVQILHERYVQGWRDLEGGFRAVIAAMEAKDYVRLASAKNEVEGGRRKMLGAFRELDGLLAEVEPELKKLRRQELAAQEE